MAIVERYYFIFLHANFIKYNEKINPTIAMNKFIRVLKVLFISFILLIGQNLKAQSSLNILTRTSGRSTLSIENINKIVFPSSGGFVITTDNGSIQNNTNLDLVRNFNFFAETTALHEFEVNTPLLLLYPNPAADYLNINLSNFNSTLGIEILSIDGKVLKKESYAKTCTAYKLNVSDLNKGIFICKVYNGKSLQIAKFIKL